jgi:hypothetical protein
MNMNEIKKKRANKRRMKIYNHLANQVGGTSSSHKLHHRASVIAEFCVNDTGPNRCTIVDGYRVWCEMNDVPLSQEQGRREGVAMKGDHKWDDFGQKWDVYDVFDDQYHEVRNKYMQRIERQWENEQAALRDVIEMPHLDPLNTDGEE